MELSKTLRVALFATILFVSLLALSPFACARAPRLWPKREGVRGDAKRASRGEGGGGCLPLGSTPYLTWRPALRSCLLLVRPFSCVRSCAHACRKLAASPRVVSRQSSPPAAIKRGENDGVVVVLRNGVLCLELDAVCTCVFW